MSQPQRAQNRSTDTRRKTTPTVAPLPPEEQKKTGVRARALQMLLDVAEGNVPALSLAVGLGTQRVHQALEGLMPLGPEMAAHIEVTCGLPGNWLDNPTTPVPEEATKRIKRALHGENFSEDDDELTSATPVAEAQAALPTTESGGLRVVEQPPVITVRRRRTTQAEVLAPVASPELNVVSAAVETTVPASSESEQQQQQPVRRGRKAGVKSVTEHIELARRAWLDKATQAKGSKSQLCRLLQAPDSFVAHLLSGRRTFTDKITEKIEIVMGLEPGTIDKATPEASAPQMPASAMPVSASADEITQAVGTLTALVLPAATTAVEPEAAPAEPEVVSEAQVKVEPTETASDVPEKKPEPIHAVKVLESVPAPAPVLEVPMETAPPVVVSPSNAAPTPHTRLDAALESALKSLLNRVIVEDRLTNQAAVRLLQELAQLVDG